MIDNRQTNDGCRDSASPGQILDLVLAASRIREELAIWNFESAMSLGTHIETALKCGAAIQSAVLPGILVLLARLHVNQAEARRGDAGDHAECARDLLERAWEILEPGDNERRAEISALQASLKSIDEPDAALALLGGKIDPYAVRTRAALLLNQQRLEEAMRVIEGLEPHERWCDVAVAIYALNGQVERAKAILRWAAGLHDRSRYPQCVVRFAGGLMARTFKDHARGATLLPHEITREESVQLETVLEVLGPVLRSVEIAGIATSDLDLSALRIALQASHLLKKRENVVRFMEIMAQWSPIPLDVARGVVGGYITAQADIPDRLRRDHPADLDAHILAGIIQSAFLSQHVEAFAEAKKLLPLADNDEKRERLFSLFQALWQNLEGPLASACEVFVGLLVAHSPQLQRVFAASVALREGKPERAIDLLDGQAAGDDAYWLQTKASALLQNGKPEEAVELLFESAKQTNDAGLLHRTGDLALQVGKHSVAVWCYERMTELTPDDLTVRANLAHIYTFVLFDLERALIQFRALHAAKPKDLTFELNLAACLTQLFRAEEGLALYEQLCKEEKPSIQSILGRAQIQHSLGRPGDALDGLAKFREAFRDDPRFLTAYMMAAHASGNDDAANDALSALNRLREAGAIRAEEFRMMPQEEGVELIKQSIRSTADRTEHIHAEMLRGRMPWVWAEQVSNSAIYMGWRTRTQQVGWIGDEPTNRAHYCIYSTNAFHARKLEGGRRELLPLECPPAGTKVVADISSLITLHRLELLSEAAEYFGEVIIPAAYMPTTLEDSLKMVLPQRTQQRTAEQIATSLDAGRIFILGDGVDSTSTSRIADEYAQSGEHRYRLVDLIRPVYQAGVVNEADYGRVSRVFEKPTAVDETHPPLRHLENVVVSLGTLEVVANLGLLGAVTGFYGVYITAQEQREVRQRLDYYSWQEETRHWHLDMWRRIRADARFKFVSNLLPDEIRERNSEPKSYLPFLAIFLAQDLKAPLIADDRVCQAFALNQVAGSAHAAFGTDVLVPALMAGGRLTPARAAQIILQLILWRYRFLVPPAALLKILADQHRGGLPGQALQTVAEYAQDCISDPGLFGGPEKTEIGESMAMRLFMTWVSTVAEFLTMVWADMEYPTDSAARITEWSMRELVPATPRVMGGHMRVQTGLFTARLLLSNALLKTWRHPGVPRMADAMKAIKEGLRLDDEEYQRIIIGVMNDTARRETKL